MRHFTLHELTKSAMADKLKIDNTPTPEVEANLNTLVNMVLDPLRELWGAPIFVTSGYRHPLLNWVVKGVPNSAHLVGLAADITVNSHTKNRKLANMLLDSDIPFDQLILYKPKDDGEASDVSYMHVSLAAPGIENRFQVIQK